MTDFDAVVIGAGAAGLAATRTLQEAGFRVQALEARPRVGGRAHTDTQSYGLPFDHGCAWLHSADVNPFRPIARELGFSLVERDHNRRRRIGDGSLPAGSIAAIDREIEHGLAAIEAAGEAGRDVPAAAVLPPAGPGRPLLDAIASWIFGVDTGEVSTLDYFRYADSGHDWPVAQGYGALVAAHGAGLPVRLATPVSEVDWSGPAIKVRTPAGTLRARACIVTLPTTVLAEQRLRFRPDLPPAKLSAIENLPLGANEKVAFRIAGKALDLPPDTHIAADAGTSRTAAVQIRPFGHDIAICYFGGGYARELAEGGALVDAAREAMTQIFGADIAKSLSAPVATSWLLDPHSRGSYSAARPGHAQRRADLAAPIDDRLFFAGEACSIDACTTCHGAHLTGIAAGKSAAAALKRPT
jgi:monoamine oxidase